MTNKKRKSSGKKKQKINLLHLLAKVPKKKKSKQEDMPLQESKSRQSLMSKQELIDKIQENHSHLIHLHQNIYKSRPHSQNKTPTEFASTPFLSEIQQPRLITP